MQDIPNRSRSTPAQGAARGRAVLLALVVAITVTACGGSGDGTPAADPMDPPGAATQEFTLVPASASLAESDDRLLLAVGATGELIWSSSDPSVASVDAAGVVHALAKGSAVISARSATGVATATLKIFRTTGPTPDPSSETLIAAALAAGQISAEESLTYRLFALFGDARLPAALSGAPSELADHLLLREVSGALPTLSQATQELLMPFLLPPIYAESWYAKQRKAVAIAAATGRKRPADVTINCFFAQPQLGAEKRTTAHFNVHNVFDSTFLQGDDDKPTTETITDLVVSLVEEVYQSETDLFKRFPLADTQENCNGGDGALDIYLHPLAGRTKALTVAYPGRCEKVPAFIVINTSELFLSLGIARGSQPLATKRKEWKSYIAHEFLHAIQFGMDRAAACKDYQWLDEATATWVMDHVEPGANFEDGGTGVASPGFARRQGKFLMNYLYNDHRVSIEKASPESNPGLNGYGDYLFFQYLARVHQPETIKAILDATEGQASVEAMASALESRGGMKAIWPKFALTLWNDDVGHVLDDWSRLDGYDVGLAAIYSPSAPPTLASTMLKTLEVDQKGQPRQAFQLLKNTLAPSGYYEIEPRSIHYEHLKFSDATVSSFYFFNPIAGLPNREFIKVQVKKKIGGTWREIEDWTAEPFKQLCLDRKDERVEEILVVVSNSEVNRGSELPLRYPKLVPMAASTSNVGCWKWQGSASTVVTGTVPGPSESTSRGNVTFEVASVLPGRLVFETSEGSVSGSSTAVAGECTFGSVGAGRAARRLPMPDGTIGLNLDLDLGFGQIGGESPDRKLVTLSASSLLSTTNTVVCPTQTQTSTFDSSWDWLHVDEPELYQASADGRTIEGRFNRTVPGGTTINTVWKFTAMRE